MQFTAHYTARSIKEATYLNRRFWRRALRAATNARAIIYLAAGIWVGVGLVVRSLHATQFKPQEMLAGILVLLLITAILLVGYWRQSAAIQKALRTQPDQELCCDDAGITAKLSNGDTTFEPWADFASFREGKSIILLSRQKNAGPRIIPTDTLNPTQTGTLRSILLNHLPERR